MGVTEENLTAGDAEWRSRLVDDRNGIARVIGSVSRIAVIGIKTEAAGGAAYFVPEMAKASGFTIVPVPVYHPEATEMLGEPVHRSLATIQPPADMVLLFRRSTDVPKHVAEILAAKPRVVWMQLGIRNEEAAEAFARAGILVVQDHCLKIELERLGR
jgi:predicted CoA-binding protein